MKLLAFDTSTEQMSIAVTRVVEGVPQLWQFSGAGGAQASGQLIPEIEHLLAQAGLRLQELDAICFGQGPGSFTGLRTACSVAQGLGFGASRLLLPVNSLLSVAEEARYQYARDDSQCSVLALLDARMDEMYAAQYTFTQGQWMPTKDDLLLRPEDLLMHMNSAPAPGTMALAGNVFVPYGERLNAAPPWPRWTALPTATAMLRLAPALLTAGHAVNAAQALPRYIRNKVAKTTLEREQAKAAIHHPTINSPT
jgi:tRNA threonylcarbamoyladenosine biosynthesis protein TsaB